MHAHVPQSDFRTRKHFSVTSLALDRLAMASLPSILQRSIKCLLHLFNLYIPDPIDLTPTICLSIEAIHETVTKNHTTGV